MSEQAEQRPRVLVVSGGGRTGTTLARLVPPDRYQVAVLRMEDEVLERVARGPVEAVVYHLRGTGRQALDLLDRLRDRECDACVLVVGRDHGAERVAALLRAGAYDYLTSPIRAGRLEESLRQGLEIRRAFLQVRELAARLKAANEDLSRDRDSLRRWNRNLESLTRLGQAMAGTLDPDAIVREVGERLPELLDYDVVGVLWWEPTRTWVHARVPLDQRVVAETRDALLARGPAGLAGAGGSPREVRDGGRATVSIEVPLLVGSQPAGLIRLARLTGPVYDRHETELVRAVATSLALALRNAEAHSQVRSLALTDSLTNVPNRRAFSQCLAREFQEAQRYGTPLCLIMVDLDHFKSLNDRFGHVFGDQLLRGVAAMIQQAVRGADVVARYGGEEFAVILPRTDLARAVSLAHRIRDRIARHTFPLDGSCVRLTASLGLAGVPDPAVPTMEALIAAADAALYRAKTCGRNRVEVAGAAGEAVPEALVAAGL
ncbi:diguanylate cyclase [Nitrospira sp. Kam-Ns4a]